MYKNSQLIVSVTYIVRFISQHCVTKDFLWIFVVYIHQDSQIISSKLRCFSINIFMHQNTHIYTDIIVYTQRMIRKQAYLMELRLLQKSKQSSCTNSMLKITEEYIR